MIAFNNGVTNILNTPGIITDDIANLPPATYVAPGTIFIYTFDGQQYMKQSDGTNWLDFGGGTPGIDSVLAINQLLTDTRNIDLNNNTFLIQDSTQANIDIAYFHYNDIRIGNTTNAANLRFLQNQIYTEYTGVTEGIYLDFNNDIYSIGSETYRIDVDAASDYIETFTNSNKYGLKLAKDFAILGDYDNYNYVLHVDSANAEIFTISENQQFGFYTTGGSLATLGDYRGLYNKTRVIVDDAAKSITLRTNSGTLQGNFDAIIFDGTLTVGGAHSNSGQHLKITINGNDYVIQLLNP